MFITYNDIYSVTECYIILIFAKIISTDSLARMRSIVFLSLSPKTSYNPEFDSARIPISRRPLGTHSKCLLVMSRVQELWSQYLQLMQGLLLKRFVLWQEC